MPKLQKNKIYSASDVAKYLIYLGSKDVVGDNDEREGVTNLKLQKLLYLAQAYYLAKLGRPLFKDPIEAWEFGPVVPKVYKEFKSYKSDPIIIEFDESGVAPEDKEVLQRIWGAFGGYSAGKLVNITHSHAPWRTAFESDNKEISNNSISEYYTPLLNK